MPTLQHYLNQSAGTYGVAPVLVKCPGCGSVMRRVIERHHLTGSTPFDLTCRNVKCRKTSTVQPIHSRDDHASCLPCLESADEINVWLEVTIQ